MDNLQPALNNDTQNENNEVKSLNLLQRIAGTVVSPAKTMKSIVERPRLLFPILAMAVGPVLVNVIRFPLYKELQRNILVRTSETMAAKFGTQVMSAEQIEHQLSTGVVRGLALAPIMSVIMWIISTAIIFGIFRAFGGQGKFKQYLSVTGYAYIVTVISLLLTLAVSYKTQNLNLDLSLGIFAGQLLSGREGTFFFGMMYTILTSCGVFVIWKYVVTAIGFVQLTGLSKVKVYSVVAGFAILSVVVTGAVTGISEALTSSISALL